MKNHRVVVTEFGAPDVLKMIEEELASPSDGEVTVKILASGVAFGDVLKRRGLMPGQPKLPFTPGYDFAGEVISPGKIFNRGDRVTAIVGSFSNTEYINVPENILVKVSGTVSIEKAACIPLNYVTAEQMLHRIARVERGQTILVHGAAGGVGTAMLQLAKLAGIKALGAASKAKHEIVKNYGGIPIDYKNEDFVARVKKEFPAGIDAVFDPVGGSHLKKSLSVLKPKGKLVAYGISSGVTGGKFEILKTFFYVIAGQIRLGKKNSVFYTINSSRHEKRIAIQEDLSKMIALLSDGKIEPLIGKTLHLKDAAEAHRAIESAAFAGKILLIP